MTAKSFRTVIYGQVTVSSILDGFAKSATLGCTNLKVDWMSCKYLLVLVHTLIELYLNCSDELQLKRFLWRAPELLRNSSPPARGTQKGDVYSFGIVLFEIVGRIGPWGELNYSNDGKLQIIIVIFRGRSIQIFV